MLACAAYGQAFPRPPRDAGPKPKNVHGVVQDARGNRLPGARIFLKDVKTKIVRTLQTDEKGEYATIALPPTVDYELYAEFKGFFPDSAVMYPFTLRTGTPSISTITSPAFSPALSAGPSGVTPSIRIPSPPMYV